MQSITTLNLNLQYPNYATVMYAVQNDRLSRKITATLYDGAVAWTPPYGSLAVVRFMKPDGTKGFYDTDENRQTAVTWTGNSVTIMLAEQVLTVPGNVLCQLNFYNASEEKLTTFLWVIKVQQSVVDDETIESTDYFNVLTHQIAEALAITAYPPYINNTTHNWMTYNAENERYEDSGISAQGERGATGPQGVSIQSVTKKSGTGAAGTTDEYNVNLDNGTVAGTFTVYNGSDGQGAPSATMPLMDGTASVGIEDEYARGDHQHPSDTSRVPTSRTINGVDLTADRTLTAENIGYDDGLPVHTAGSVGEELASLSDSLNSEVAERQNADNAIESSIAIVANGNTHAAIASDQYVYVKNHSTLAEGLYKATASIPQNGAISTSNVTAVSSGGLNNLIGGLFEYSSTGSGQTLSAYVKFFNGVLICWGGISTYSSSSKTTEADIEFAYPFAAANSYAISLGAAGDSSGQYDLNTIIYTTYSATGFTAKSINNTPNINKTASGKYIAVGRWK